jgi:hypothetical protein
VGMRVHASRMIDGQDVGCTGSFDIPEAVSGANPTQCDRFASLAGERMARVRIGRCQARSLSCAKAVILADIRSAAAPHGSGAESRSSPTRRSGTLH